MVRARVRGRRRSIRSLTVSVCGGMRCERHLGVTSRIKWPALAVLHFWDWPQGHEPVFRFPRPPTPPVHSKNDHMGEALCPPPGGFSVFWRRRVRGADAALCGGKDRRPFHSGWLPASWPLTHVFRTRGPPMPCVLFGLARLAPVQHWLADPPICVNDARIARHRTPSSFARGGRRRDRVCGRRWRDLC